MARALRIEYSGACYHVINRGNYRQDLFEEEGAAAAFERTLGEAAERFGWKVHAYVIMRNHFHLAVETPEPNLSEGMKWLQGTWSRRFNGMRKLVGRPFQGRYKGLLLEPGHALAQVCHYIHLNPVRANVVEAEKLQDYRWSSLSRFSLKGRPGWLEAVTVLADAGELPDDAKGWRRYRAYLAFRSLEKGESAELSRERLSKGWCVGSNEFRREQKKAFENKNAALDLIRFAGLEPQALTEERQESWEEQLVAYAKAAKVELNQLPPKKSASEKVLLAAAMKLSSSVSNRWLASRLNMGEPASVSQFVRRWLQDPKRERQVQVILSRVKT